MKPETFARKVLYAITQELDEVATKKYQDAYYAEVFGDSKRGMMYAPMPGSVYRYTWNDKRIIDMPARQAWDLALQIIRCVERSNEYIKVMSKLDAVVGHDDRW